MKEIKLTKGRIALVDDNIFDLLNKFKWHVDRRGYACGYMVEKAKWGVKSKSKKMHRIIIGAKHGEMVDHINRKKLDNRRENLRIISNSLNALNGNLRSTNKSGVTGVTWVEKRNRWRSVIWDNYKMKNKYFRTKEEAVNQRNQWYKERMQP